MVLTSYVPVHTVSTVRTSYEGTEYQVLLHSITYDYCTTNIAKHYFSTYRYIPSIHTKYSEYTGRLPIRYYLIKSIN